MDVMQIRRGLLMAMIISSSFDPNPELFCTLSSEMHLKDLLSNNPIPLKYESEFLFVRMDNDSSATQGSSTANWLIFYVENKTSKFLFTNYKNSLVAPNTMNVMESFNGVGASYFAISNNKITNTNTTNSARYYPSGTKVYIKHIPFYFPDFKFESNEI